MSACSVQQRDSHECILPNGDKFVLISKYGYEPLATLLQPLSGHLAERLNQESFHAFYQPLRGKRREESVSIIHNNSLGIGDPEGRRQMCASFTQNNGDISTTSGELLAYGTNQFRRLAIDTLKFPDLPADGPYGEHGGPGGVAAALIENTIFYEIALLHRPYVDQKIAAVYQKRSVDDGKSWSKPL